MNSTFLLLNLLLSNAFLRVSAAVLADHNDRDKNNRDLSRIAGYEPETLVSEENEIDLDFKEIETQLQLGSIEGYNAAMDVYNKGAYSAPIAKLKVDPLQSTLTSGDVLSGLSTNLEQEVKLTVVSNYPPGRDAVLVKYTNTTTCIVGGLSDPIVDGCLAGSGRLMVAGSSTGTTDQIINYTYNVLEDNLNEITLRRLSTEKKTETTYWCKQCESGDYSAFYKYYGVPDYADQWVTAAGEGKATDFYNGNANFEKFGLAGKSKAITTAILVLHIWMHIIWLMEELKKNSPPPISPPISTIKLPSEADCIRQEMRISAISIPKSIEDE